MQLRAGAGPTDAGTVLAGIGGGPLLRPGAGLYLHVPFCFHKCHYCDFYSIVDTRDRQGEFTKRLIAEVRALAKATQRPRLATIFVGGGTPSLLAVGLWQELLAALAEAFDLSGLVEFTVECNPETVSAELMAVLAAGGVNRVSIGAQSFHAQHLKTLERWHDPANVFKAVELARAVGIARQSMDLIFAIPGQTMTEWDADLKAALGAGTTHLSCYALTYEPNTAMTARMKKGEFSQMPGDLEADMFEHTLSTLRAAGLERYEVSNFAKKGDECRHNLAYWRQHDWLAAGPNASAHVRGVRWKNIQRLDDYLNKHVRDFAMVTDVEYADAVRNLSEAVWTGLRLAEGIDAAQTLAAADAAKGGMAEKIMRVARRQMELGAIVRVDDRWQLSDQGFMIADAVAVAFLEVIE
ncbi:putative oxygen-independent coproporphyrinogen III oxidase HemN [Phycisphaerae bacterium]|nr:putative oxygen-independent coproporphyrinogen III oxidase HemN [Phycisphaerae bacterium]